MIKDLFVSTIVVTMYALLFWGILTDLSTASGVALDSTQENKYSNLKNNLTEAYSDVSSYAQSGYSGVAGISTNPQQSEGQDIISIMGRFATSVVKTFINAFTIPVIIIESFAIALDIPVAYAFISSFIVSLFMIYVILEILSMAIRYPVDR